MEPNNYDRIAGFYDVLAGLVFGRARARAQIHLLCHIPAGSRILVVGGGTGALLEELALIHPRGQCITYVEISARMSALAAKRKRGANRVDFVHRAVEQFEDTRPYDVVCTPFLFDNFREEKAAAVFEKLDALLKPGGLWLYADFRPAGRWWQKKMLAAMYLFFRVVSRIEADRLTDMAPFFARGYAQVSEAAYYAGFIWSAVYRKD